MNRSDFRYLDAQRVRWAEVDMQKIVFNGHYLMYIDTAVAGWWRAMAVPYEAAMHRLGGDLYVRKATLEYAGSARYDERLATGVRCQRIGNSSIVLQAAVFRDEAALVTGELVYVFADPATQTSRPVPPALRALMTDYEAGAAMLDLRTGAYSELRDTVVALRAQTAALDVAEAEADVGALHAVAFNRLGMAVGCARRQAGAASADAQRVLGPLRGAGIGAALRQALAGA
jgi:YbgC/YbaW family acyl-CoA thioester hydrolase